MNKPALEDQAVAAAPVALFLRIGTVVKVTGLGRSTIYRLIAEDRFPQPVRVAHRAVAWRQTDLNLWCAGCKPPRDASQARGHETGAATDQS